MPSTNPWKSCSVTKKLTELDALLSVYSASATFLLSFVLANIVLFSFGFATEYGRWEDPLRSWGIGIARGFGYCLNLNVALILILACRATLTALRRTVLNVVIPFDKAMPLYHSFCGYSTLVCAIMHAAGHSVGFARNMWSITGYLGWRYCIITGSVLFSVLSLMVIFAYKPMRDKNFERFIASHFIGAFVFCGLLVFHGIYVGKLYTYKWILGPCALYLADRIYRKVNEESGSVFVRINGSKHFSNGILKLSIPKVFRFQAGQYIELKIPKISKTEWHPFTISSAPHEPSMTFYIKPVGKSGTASAKGSWTRQLKQMFIDAQPEDECSVTDSGEVEIHVRGPYGAPAQHTGQYDRVALISGGVGSTPFLSITKQVRSMIRGYEEIARLKSQQIVELKEGKNGEPNPRSGIGFAESSGSDSDRNLSRHFSSNSPTDQNGRSVCFQNNSYSRGSSSSKSLDQDQDGDYSETSYASGSDSEEADNMFAGMSSIGVTQIGKSRIGGGVGTLLKKRETKVEKAGVAGKLKKRATFKRTASDTLTTEDETWAEFLLNHVSYSAMINTVLLLWVIIIRFAFNLTALAFFDVELGSKGSQIFKSDAVMWVDLILGSWISLTIVLQMTIEAFANSIEIVDLIVILPLISTQTVVHLFYLNGVLLKEGGFANHCFVIIWPLAITSFLARYFRIAGRRILLVESVTSSHRQLRSVDFIWTTPTAGDDEWLCSDLADTMKEDNASRGVRLHRFLTRETEPDLETGEAIGAIPGFKNNFGRPDWYSLFTAMASNSPNGVCIGVFVCGPKALTADVKKAALRAMIESRQRSHAYRKHSGGPSQKEEPSNPLAEFEAAEVSSYGFSLGNSAALAPEGGQAASKYVCGYGKETGPSSRATIEDWTRSFNVRFVVREENF